MTTQAKKEKPLSEKQMAIFRHLFEVTATTGRPPSYRAIAAHFGVSSPNTINSHMRALVRKGYLGSRAAGSAGPGKEYRFLRKPDGEIFKGFTPN